MTAAKDVPAGWSRRRLRFDAHLNPLKSRLDLSGDTEVSFVPMDAVGELGGLALNETRPVEEIYNGYTYFANEDVVVAKITPCFENGKGALAQGLTNGVAFGTTELHVIRPQSGLDARFLFYLTIAHDFRSFGEAEMLGAGGQKRVPEEFLKDWRAPLPPLETQQRIARFLDEKTAWIDGLIAKKRALLERLAEKRQALITHAVTKGLNPAAPMKPFGINWLGDIPAHWELKRLRYVVRLLSGSTPTTGIPEYWGGDIPWISPKDMKSDALSDSIDKVTRLAVEEYGLREFREPNGVLVVHGMILARRVPVAVASGVYTINQDMKVMESKGLLSPAFLQMYLASIENYLMTLVGEAGHGTKALRTDVLLDTPILIPSSVEQATIVTQVEDQKSDLDRAARKIEALGDRLAEYRAALITAAVTGNIGGLQ